MKNILLIIAILIISSCTRNNQQSTAEKQKKPNILFIFIDDMGYADLGCYGNKKVHTPNIDQLAKEGILFSQFYVNSPICSPSSTAVTTGNYPSHWGITSFIARRAHNVERGVRDFLTLDAPSVARNIQAAGYYTAHIGKWHMGGGRDVGEAPLIMEYGFDESVTQFEGLGERYLALYETFDFKDGIRNLESQSSKLGRGEVHWARRDQCTEIFVDRTIQAIENAQKADKPFYVNLWPDHIHTPLEPPKALRGDLSTEARFLGVMHEMDKQMGRLFDYIRNNKDLHENTLIVFTSDNGPDGGVNDAGVLKGSKSYLYEGGIREPFIAWWPSTIPKDKMGTKNVETVMAGIDLPLTFMDIAEAQPDKDKPYDGESMVDAISGKTLQKRSKSIMWIRPPDRGTYKSKSIRENAPDLAIRKGDHKLLMDFDGSNIQLYNLEVDIGETNNLKDANPEKVNILKTELSAWFENYQHDIELEAYAKM